MPRTEMKFPGRLQHACTIKGKTPVLKLDRSRLLLAFKQKQSRETVQQLLIRVPLLLEGLLDAEKNHHQAEKKHHRERPVINHTDRRFWVRTIDRTPLSDKLRRLLEKQLKNQLAWIAPVYQTIGIPGLKGVVAPVPDTLLIKPRPQAGLTDGAVIQAVTTRLAEMKCAAKPNRAANLAEEAAYVPYTIEKPEGGTIYRLKSGRRAIRKGPIDDVQFDFMPLVSTVAWANNVTKDPLSAHQWNLPVMNWDTVYQQRSAGNLGQNIVVAVLDKGCDLGHPDLQGSFVTGATFHGPAQVTVPRGTEAHATDMNPHGTCCAGIIAAHCDNNIGVSGLAPGCRIMPVRLETETAAELAEAIKFACDSGAKVISISMASPQLDTIDVRVQIRRAAAKDVVICASSGNDSSPALSYPAADPHVIACGAITQTGTRCTTADWGASGDANFGNGLSVVAPGVGIPTTIHSSGSGGHWPADYRTDFYGTSSASPQVAALAAVILSLKPRLTLQEVRDIIEDTAQRLPNYQFADSPQDADGTAMPQRKGWDREVGYGLIDFSAAITKALTYP